MELLAAAQMTGDFIYVKKFQKRTEISQEYTDQTGSTVYKNSINFIQTVHLPISVNLGEKVGLVQTI